MVRENGFKRNSFVICLLVIVCFIFVLPGSVVLAETREVCPVDCAYTTIQSAINAAVDGDVISVKNGIYAEVIWVNKPISLIGESRDGVIIDASGHTGYAISVTASNVILGFFTVQNGNDYGIKISGVNNFTLQYVTVNQMARSGVDLNGVDTAVLNNIRSTGSVAGVGIAITDSQNIDLNDILTSGNAWGGIGIYTLGEFHPGGVDGVTLTGLNTIQENPPIYVEIENFASPSEPYPVTNLDMGEFRYLVTNSSQPNLSVYYTTFVQARATILFVSAQNFATIQDVISGDYLVSPGLKIHAAVKLAADNSRIFAYNGEYLEPQILIDKNITITGESQSGTIFKPLDDTEASGDAAGWFVVNDGFVFDLNNVTLDGLGKNIHQAIRSFGSGTIQNVTFKNISYPGYQGTAVANLGQNMTIANNTFLNIGRTGVLVSGPGIGNTIISDNAYTGKGSGDWVDYAVEVDGGAVVLLKGNTISGNIGETLGGLSSAGVLVTTQNGTGTRAQLYGNTVHGCTDAVRVGVDSTDTSVVVMHQNDFSGNSNGVFTYHSPVDARMNWWGDLTGPSSGDGVSEDVNYSPWLGLLPATTPMILHTDGNIQAAIDAAEAGDSIYVHPGVYNEIAENRYLFDGSGPYQFGLFIPVDKPNLSIVGVDDNGLPVSSYSSVLAQVQLNATNDFGPSGLFVEADQITVSGLQLSQHPDFIGKTIEVIGNAFTLQYSHVLANQSTALVFNDWRFDEASGSSHLQEYSINQNRIEDGFIDLYNGAGYSGPVTGRLMTNNVFDGFPLQPTLQFTGSIASSPIYVYPVGGAIIYGNQFTDAAEHILVRGDYDNSQFNWADYWNENIFDQAVMVGTNPPENIRSYVNGLYPNSRRIGSVIQAEINHALPDDTVLVKDGLYEENLLINQNISLIGQGENTILLAPELIPTCFAVTNPNYNAHPVICIQADHVTVDHFTVDGAGRGNSNYKFMGIAFQNAGGAVKNTVITRIKSSPITMDDNGLALFVYNNDGTNRSFTVDQVTIEDFQKNAMAISALADTPLAVNITNNHVTGQGHTSLVVQNGIQVWGDLLTGTIEGNSVDDIGFISTNPDNRVVATSILNYYADVDVLRNTVTEAQIGLYVYDGSGRYIDNQFEIFKVGYSGFGMILTDPPGAVPSPSVVNTLDEKSRLPNEGVKTEGENIIFAENNQVLFNGTDNTGTIGIDAEAGHGVKDVNVNINANTVRGFDFGITLLQCGGTTCTDSVFTHLQALCNLISENNKGMYSNVTALEMFAPYNWWGDPSGPYHPSFNPDGLGDSVTGLIDFTPWLEEPVCMVNFPPLARGDVYKDAVQNVTYQTAAPGVLANDMDLNDDPITAVLVDDVQFGALTLNADGSFTYIPEVNFIGVDSFTYAATDGVLNSEPVTVTITVLPGIPITSGGTVYLPVIMR